MTPEEVAKKTLADVKLADAKMKLTWNPDKPPLAPIDRVVGRVECVDKERNIWRVIGVNLSLPYMRIATEFPGRYYWIQNAKLFRPNGDETTLDDIQASESDQTYATVKNAYETHIREAIVRDDALCKICTAYRSRDHEDYLTHMVNEHPEHVARKFQTAPEPEPTVTPAVESQTPAVSELSCCGRTFKDRRGLVGHKKFKHAG